ncbi:MAG: ATP-dependent zinc metalloprotease FtsH, partial [Chloroflexi bacterium]|nr:ATP-dependent zinc metalloprotease FtsH [Chloroflexota bacterium]
MAVLIALFLSGAGLIWLLTVGLGGASTSTGPVSGGQPTFTTAGERWTLDEALAGARTGEVDAISAMTPGAGTGSGAAAPVLIVRTVAGAIHAIRPEVSIGDALDVIRASGYARLLTDEAIALDPGANDGGLPSFFGLAMSVGLLVLAILLFARLRGIASRAWRPSRFGHRRRRTDKAIDGERPRVTLADVAGADEAKLELTETIEFLRDPSRFVKLGATAIRGVMLYGPPGTGKTLLAKAVAAEANVPFFSVSGSEFVEKYVGVGAGRVRELFAKARAAGRAVIFIDEIDAMAKARGGSDGHEEREQTLNQLLVEMDGFGTSDGVVVIGATNRIDTLDPAALRPGRFTRKIHVPLPDRDGRLAILAIHARGKPLAPAVDLLTIARKTYGFSGAMLADLLNEAAILAARAGLDEIGPTEVHNGWLKSALGTSRKRSMDERERSIIAAHEAGHAVCGFVHGDKRRVEEISLFAHGEALGVTVSSSEDNDLPSETDLRARLVALMGGRVAEELLFHEVTGGASNDFETATSMATTMVVRFGMGRDPDATEDGATGRGILTTLVGDTSVGFSRDVRDAQARAIRSILDAAYTAARRTLIAEMPRLRDVAAYLYEQERIDGDEFEAVMGGRLRSADGDGWRAAASSPRAWDTIPTTFQERSPHVNVELPPIVATPAPVRVPAPTPAPVRVLAPTPAPAPGVELPAPVRGRRPGR